MKFARILVGIFLMIVLIGLTGCAGAERAAATPPPEAEPTSLPTEAPPATATPLPPVGVLLAPEGADPALVEALQTHLTQAIPAAGLRYQMRLTLSTESIQADDIQWVIALPPAPDLAAWAAAAPETRFLVVGANGIEAAANISVIGADGGRFDQQGFLAGYIAAMLTPDWRVGVISVADTEAGQLARRSFLTGAKFYCGACSPTYPPFFEYPLYYQANAGADAAEWQAAADFLLQRNVEMIYLGPGVGDENLMRYIAQAGARMIGGSSPPEDLRASWVVSLTFSPLEAYYNFWPEFAAGSNGQAVDVSLAFSEINSDWISTGRLHRFEEIYAGVQSGMIESAAETIP